MIQQVKTLWVGLDVSKSTMDAAPHIPGTTKVQVASFARTLEGAEQLLAWSDKIVAQHLPGAQVRFVMEATGSYSMQLLQWLIKLQPSCGPAIINPTYIKAFGLSLGKRNKTDKTDARTIAHYGHERQPAPEQLPNPAMARLRELVRERSHLVQTITAEKNRQQEPCDDPFLIKLRLKRIAQLDKQLDELNHAIEQQVKKNCEIHKDIDLLKSIPGVGFTVAVSVLAEVGDLRRFSHGRKLAAFCGLSPQLHQSGTINRPTRMCRRGNCNVRPMLHLGARSLVGRKRPLSRFYEHLVKTGKTKRAALAAVSRKLLILMRAVLVNNTPYTEDYKTSANNPTLWNDPNLNSITI